MTFNGEKNYGVSIIYRTVNAGDRIDLHRRLGRTEGSPHVRHNPHHSVNHTKNKNTV
jgi:hypothetical protein